MINNLKHLQTALVEFYLILAKFLAMPKIWVLGEI
jgi:hypothetical protein